MDLQDRGSERRLATILVADVVGFSRWMEADKSGALAAINRLLGDMLKRANCVPTWGPLGQATGRWSASRVCQSG